MDDNLTVTDCVDRVQVLTRTKQDYNNLQFINQKKSTSVERKTVTNHRNGGKSKYISIQNWNEKLNKQKGLFKYKNIYYNCRGSLQKPDKCHQK